MIRSKILTLLLVGAFALSTVTACLNSSDITSSGDGNGQVAAAALDSVAVANSVANTQISAPATPSTASVAAALAENFLPRDDTVEVAVDSAPVQITLAGDAISVDGPGVTVNGSTATITAASAYRLSGTLADGQIVVDTEDKETVHLILDGADLRNSTGAPLNVIAAAAVVIVLADGSKNTVSDAASYVFADAATDEPNAAIFSKTDLTITGDGALAVQGNFNDGIASKDGLVIAGGSITVEAVDDGIRGKDYLLIEAGNISVVAQGDGLKADNEENAAKGYIAITGGVIEVNAGGDAITAQTDVLVGDGQLTLSSGGGSNSPIDESTSAKGIKAAVSVTIDGGIFAIDAADDAIHANDSITINGGDFTLASGDDGMHADSTLTINDGEIRITQSYEGIESAVITIDGGAIDIMASDDGVNVAGGNDGSGTAAGMQPGGRPGRGGPGMDAFTFTGHTYLYINGGTMMVEATGDGIDVNGAIEMTGGLVVVNGPTQQMNSALDYDASFTISGGLLAAAGSAGMAQAPGEASSQLSLLLNFPSALPAGTIIHIQTSTGDELLTFAPLKPFQSIAFSSAALAKGMAVEIYYDGSAAGASLGGLYLDGAYTPGTQVASFTLANVVTRVGNSGR
jgi:hypothetical protein